MRKIATARFQLNLQDLPPISRRTAFTGALRRRYGWRCLLIPIMPDRILLIFPMPKGEGFISLSGSKPFHSICDTFCRTVGFVPNVIFESDSPSTVRDLIGSGMGIGFWPAYTWGDISTPIMLLCCQFPCPTAEER